MPITAVKNRTTKKLANCETGHIDLRDHHFQCEINFQRLLKLMHEYQHGRDRWRVSLSGQQFTVSVLERAPYTTTVEIVQQHEDDEEVIPDLNMRVRLYHDVGMAEVVSWDGHRNLSPKYDYPNRQMYSRDEKLAQNRFLGDFLRHCVQHAYTADEKCEFVLINRS